MLLVEMDSGGLAFISTRVAPAGSLWRRRSLSVTPKQPEPDVFVDVCLGTDDVLQSALTCRTC